MPGLPPDLQNIVWEYLQAFEVVLNLPKLSAVKKLIRKSNDDIIARYIFYMCEMTDITDYRGLLMVLNFNILPSSWEFHAIIQAMTTSVMFCFPSSSLRWLIFEKKLAKYPQFREVLCKSIFFKCLSISALS